jgi:predicted metal-dependent RNase
MSISSLSLFSSLCESDTVDSFVPSVFCFLSDQLEVTAYYAGHVIGAAMFHIRVGTHSIVYTGDYNMTPDRHLGSASIDRSRMWRVCLSV